MICKFVDVIKRNWWTTSIGMKKYCCDNNSLMYYENRYFKMNVEKGMIKLILRKFMNENFHYNENSSLQWKYIDEMNLMIVMKIHKCDENISL